MRTIFIVGLVGALALAGCANTTPNTTNNTTSSTTMTTPDTMMGGAHELHYAATQSGTGNDTKYAFSGPATAAAGWAHVTLTNNGSEPHQIVFYRLPANETYAQHVAMMMSNGSSGSMGSGSGDMMDNMSAHAKGAWVGGVASSSPLPPPQAPQPPVGANVASSWIFLAPGHYIAECEIPGPIGPHVMHGMMIELNVTGDMPTDMMMGAPASDLALKLVDFNFTWTGTPTAGHHVVKVENKGSMPHEAVLLHLAANKTVQDFLAWEQGGAVGAPPVMDTFGAGALSPGEVEYVDVGFAPGSDYGEICFLPDASGTPHLAHGMIGQFHVA